jgi:NtrC-family two-component system sensor histidine kinase KinB
MRTPTDAPARSRGLGLRTKLALGFVALLAVLLAVGVESISLLDELGGSIDVILRENYKSVIACKRMKEALERLDSGALFALAGEAPQGSALVGENRPRFDAALKTELGNITLPGERRRAERLRALFAAYQPALQRVLDPQIPLEARRGLYFQQLYPTFRQIKETADQILQMNQQNMVDANDRARALAQDATRRMALLLLAGTAVAGLCILLLSRAILGPLERLTAAAGEIESGNLELTVPVTSQDELGQLAAAFNAMAGGLRELRQTDQALLLRGRRLSQSAIDHLPEAVSVLLSDRRVELANRAASSLLGLRPGETLPPQHAAWLLPLLDRVGSGRLPEGGSEAAVCLGSEGRERFFLPRVAVLRDGHGRAEGWILVLDDVTHRRRQRELHASLLANAAHDLEKASSDAWRLGEIAANLLAVSHLEERREQLHPEPIPAAELVDAAVREEAPLYRQQQVKLVATVDAEAPRLLVDRERAGLVLALLLRNARAHTPAGGSVTVEAGPWEGRVRLSVADTGRGIPAADRERIFEPFYQVPGTEDLGDAGLGLGIARDIVQTHGGEIHCESDGGRGATFWFTLPAAAN